MVAVTLMENPKTGELMSKSKGTGIFLDVSADDKFGQVMAQPDEMIEILLVNCTLLPLGEIGEIIKSNPRDAKIRLAHEIVKIFHGDEKADEAQEYFIGTFSRGETPEDVREVKVEWVDAYDAHQNVLDFMVSAGLAKSKSEARRKIEQGGVSINGEKISVGELILNPDSHNGKIMKVGKKSFIKIVF